jgi:hypothetical protein
MATRMMISALLLTAMLVACGDDDDAPPPPAVDGGMTTMDAGDPGVDAGDPVVDAGDPGVDAGDPSTDAGMMASGACTNEADTTTLMSIDIGAIVEGCVRTTFGAQPATSNCIGMMSGLSAGCTACFGETVTCVTMSCLTQCLAGGSSPGCVSCRMMNCDPAFAVCSGLTAM